MLKKTKKLHIPLKIAALICAAGFVFGFFINGAAESGVMTARVFSVGTANAQMLTLNDTDIVVDCGGSLAGRKILHQLDTQNKRDIDIIILSHYHKDHMQSIGDLMENTRVKQIIAPYSESEDDYKGMDELIAYEKAYGTKLTFLDRDMELTFSNGLKLRIFYDQTLLDSKNQNERSLVVLAEYKEFEFMTMGDSTLKNERELTVRHDDLDSDVLVTGHHGSKTSTSAELLEAARPKTAVISLGSNNTYGFPKQEVLDLIAQYGIPLLRTDTEGDITFSSKGTDTFRIRTQKGENYEYDTGAADIKAAA